MSMLLFLCVVAFAAHTLAQPPMTDPQFSLGTPANNIVTPTAYQISQLMSYEYIIVLDMAEDSFDNLFATYPGAENIQTLKAAGTYNPQVDQNGVAYPFIPIDPTNNMWNASIPNAPYDVVVASGGNITTSTVVGNPSHSFFQTKYKINGGLMNTFVLWGGVPPNGSISNHGGISMSYYDLSKKNNTGLWLLASQYTLMDHMFTSFFGDTVVAHMYLIGGKSVQHPAYQGGAGTCPDNLSSGGAPNSSFAPVVYTSSGWTLSNPTYQNVLTRDCYFVGNIHSPSLCQAPYFPLIPSGISNPAHIGDLLDLYSNGNATWAYYSEDWFRLEVSNCTNQPADVNVNEQPLLRYSQFSAENNSQWLLHTGDPAIGGSNFFYKLTNNLLEKVTWYTPNTLSNCGFSNNSPDTCNTYLDSWFAQLYATPQWQANKVVVVLHFPTANGLFDHVAPYVGDQFGPGLRSPTIVISPSHRNGGVNKGLYETYSINKMIARRWGVPDSALQTLWGTARFNAAQDLTTTFPATSNIPTSSSTGHNAATTSSKASDHICSIVAVLVIIISCLDL